MRLLSPEDVLAMDRENLLTLGPRDIGDRQLTPAEIRHILERLDALWLHSGDPSRPHAELTAGDCSDGFVNVGLVLKYPDLCLLFGRQLYLAVRNRYSGHVDWVVSSDHAAATLGFATAHTFEAEFDFCEKGPDKTQAWRRFPIAPNEVVLQVEELMTAASTTEAVRRGIQEAHTHPITFAPVVAVFVDRSDVTRIGSSDVIPLVHYDIQTWGPEDCPLCAVGSQRLRPKQHWAELTGK